MKNILAKTALFSLLTVGAAATLATERAEAAPFGCGAVPVTMVGVSSTGIVYASLAGIGNNLMLCNVETASNGWTVQSCRALLSELNAALLSGKKATPMWESEKKDNCTVIPDWTNIAASYGFYWMSIAN